MALDDELWARATLHPTGCSATWLPAAATRDGACSLARASHARGCPTGSELCEELFEGKRRRERGEGVPEVRNRAERSGVGEVLGAHRRGGIFQHAEYIL